MSCPEHQGPIQKERRFNGRVNLKTDRAGNLGLVELSSFGRELLAEKGERPNQSRENKPTKVSSRT